MNEKASKVQMIEAEAPPEPVPEPTVVNPLSLDAFCRNVAQRVPPETLSVFYTTESAQGRSRGTFEEFAKRLYDFQNAPLG